MDEITKALQALAASQAENSRTARNTFDLASMDSMNQFRQAAAAISMAVAKVLDDHKKTIAERDAKIADLEAKLFEWDVASAALISKPETPK